MQKPLRVRPRRWQLALEVLEDRRLLAGDPIEGKPWEYIHDFNKLSGYQPGDFEGVIDWGDGKQETVHDIQDAGNVFRIHRFHTYLDDGSVPLHLTINIIKPGQEEQGWQESFESQSVQEAPFHVYPANIGGKEGTKLTGGIVAIGVSEDPTPKPDEFTGTVSAPAGTYSTPIKGKATQSGGVVKITLTDGVPTIPLSLIDFTVVFRKKNGDFLGSGTAKAVFEQKNIPTIHSRPAPGSDATPPAIKPSGGGPPGNAAVSIELRYDYNLDGVFEPDIDGVGTGTGTLISPYQVLTAGHNVASFPDWIYVFPDRSSRVQRPLGEAFVTNYSVPPAYASGGPYDLAVLDLDRNIGKLGSWLSYAKAPNAKISDPDYRVALWHYPAAGKPGADRYHKFFDKGPLNFNGGVDYDGDGTLDQAKFNQFLYYSQSNLFTWTGSSGAGVLDTTTWRRPTIVGVHVSGERGQVINGRVGLNKAVRLDGEKVAWIDAQVNAVPLTPPTDQADLWPYDDWHDQKNSTAELITSGGQQQLKVTADIFNGGTAKSGGFDVQFVLDRSGVSRHTLGTVHVDPLDKGLHRSVVFTGSIPAGLAAGDYRILFKIDSTKKVAEKHEEIGKGYPSDIEDANWGSSHRVLTISATGQPSLGTGAIPAPQLLSSPGITPFWLPMGTESFTSAKSPTTEPVTFVATKPLPAVVLPLPEVSTTAVDRTFFEFGNLDIADESSEELRFEFLISDLAVR